VQKATAQSKTGIFRDFGVAEAPPGFQAGWSDCMYDFFSLSLSLLIFPAHKPGRTRTRAEGPGFVELQGNLLCPETSEEL
jgi:hypothetical protein